MVIYLTIINALAFVLMLADKYKAVKKRWRIPEAVLMGVAFLGGSLGAILGMYLVRHKTRHPLFAAGLPLLLMAQVLIVIFLLKEKVFL